METVVFEDPTVCQHSKYLGWAKGLIERLPDLRRNVYLSANPICTFACALSRDGARKVLQHLGGVKGEAFDVIMMHACRRGVLKCISVVPEVVHQYFPAEDFGVKSLVDIGNGEEGSPVDPSFKKVMGSTENILHRARRFALWGQTCLRELCFSFYFSLCITRFSDSCF